VHPFGGLRTVPERNEEDRPGGASQRCGFLVAGQFDVEAAEPAVVCGGQMVIEGAELTPHPHDKQNVGPPARDG
jgi:hypothetical protein